MSSTSPRTLELVEELGPHRRADEALARHDGTDRRGDLLDRDLLEQVAGGAGLDRLVQVALLVGDGQHDDLRRRGPLGDESGGFDAVDVGHADVHEHDIGDDVRHTLHRIAAVLGQSDLYEAIKAGATGYLLKEISIEEVASAVRAVVSGQSLISPSMASKLLNEFTNLAKRADERTSVPTPRLTERELEVLRLVAQGMSNREIAGELYISENTVKNHVRNILEKLHLHTRMEAVMYAVREKLLDIPGT